MAYVKHGKGPNDHKKGNRTRGADRRGGGGPEPGTTPANYNMIEERRQDAADTKAYYMDIAASLDNVIKYNQDYAIQLRDNLQAYIREARENKEPLTMAGMILASGVSGDTYYRMRQGEHDWLLPAYMDRHSIPYDRVGSIWTDEDGQEILLVQMSRLIKTAELELQADRERLCMDKTARNAGGAIFLLKAQQGLQDTPQPAGTTNQTLNINVASLDEAREALKRLG